MRYSVQERQDMYNIYIKNNKNSYAALRGYSQMYPERNQPSYNTFVRIYKNISTEGRLSKLRKKYGPRDTDNDVNVLAQIELNKEGSSRLFSRECGISKSGVCKIIKKYKYHDYKYLPVQKLYVGDSERRLLFSEWITAQSNNDRSFADKILWTDESLFTNTGMFNRRNKHYYSTQNQHLVQEVRNQYRYSLNVWCGLLDGKLVGPHFIDGNLTGNAYLNFLRVDLENMLETLPVQTFANLTWFQHDGAPAHSTRVVTEYLRERFLDNWIGINGPVRWPARSPCFNPLDYFLWGCVKNKVYNTPVNDIGELRQRIIDVSHSVSSESIRKAVAQITKRARLCIQHQGRHFEQFL